MQKNRFLFLLVKWIMPAVMVILIGLIAFLKPTPKLPGTIQGIISFKSTCPAAVCEMTDVEVVMYRLGGNVIVAKTKPNTTGEYVLSLPPATYIVDAKLEKATSSDTPREVRLESEKTEVLNIELKNTD